MKTTYIPVVARKGHRHAAQKSLIKLFALLLLPPTMLSLANPASAANASTWDSTNFSDGSYSSTVLDDTDVTLSQDSATTDTSYEDFFGGIRLSDNLSKTAVTDSGSVGTYEGYRYTPLTDPALPDYGVRHALKDGDTLYISTAAGLAVIDTNGTVDPSDDTLLGTYDTGSSPAIADNSVYSASATGTLLYVSTGGGLSVINTQGTATLADDTLVTSYTTGSSPAIANNYVYYSFTASTSLYIGTQGGLTVINMQGTVSAGDDTLVTTYNTGSSPALAHNYSQHGFLDGDILYVNTNAGLTVINTQGTLDPSDDTLVISYKTSSTPALAHNNTYHSFLDGDLLYISTGSGVSVIDTQGTASSSDDTLLTRYQDGSTIKSAQIEGDLLYIFGNTDTFVIDTQGTSATNDDVRTAIYTTDNSTTTPILSGMQSISRGFVDSGSLYLSGTFSGLFVLTPNAYHTAGTFESLPRQISTTPTSTITIDADIAAGENVTLSYRTGDATAVWFDDFDTDDAYSADLYGWGTSFGTATITDSVLQLSDPSDTYVVFWLEPSVADDYFQDYSQIAARVRMVNPDPDVSYEITMFTDEWRQEAVRVSSNEWITMALLSEEPEVFDDFGFNVETTDSSAWDPNARFEIDWVKITTDDGMGGWNSWNACADQVCTLPDLGSDEWLQYKLELTTNDTSSTPLVNSVSYGSGYTGSGTYTSSKEVFGSWQDVLTFTADTTTPSGTSIAFTYSIDEGASWTPVNSGDTIDRTADSFTWRATLSTTDPATTPQITSVTLTSTNHTSTGGGGGSSRTSSSDQEPESTATSTEALPNLLTSTTTATSTAPIETDTSGSPSPATMMKYIEVMTETVRLLTILVGLQS